VTRAYRVSYPTHGDIKNHMDQPLIASFPWTRVRIARLSVAPGENRRGRDYSCQSSFRTFPRRVVSNQALPTCATGSPVSRWLAPWSSRRDGWHVAAPA